ncbi:MAG TPA: hypothetical protein VGF45_23995, partial [Polyangia bacterium]
MTSHEIRLVARRSSAWSALALLAFVACSSDAPAGGSGGTSGASTGGRSGTGGSTPTSTGGQSGNVGGAGSGGTSGAGGSGGGAPSPGSGGSTANDANGDAPLSDASDASNVPRLDGITSDARDSASGDTNNAASLDACFAGLRPTQARTNQVGNKATADGRYQVRLALEYTPGMIGTSGTKPLRAYRFGIVTPEGIVCVSDEATLMNAYKVSHHNCDDTFDLTFQGRRYQITQPAVDPTLPGAQLTITEGTTKI